MRIIKVEKCFECPYIDIDVDIVVNIEGCGGNSNYLYYCCHLKSRDNIYNCGRLIRQSQEAESEFDFPQWCPLELL